MSDITVALGKKIRSLRQAHGWTQENLAEYADLHVSYIVLLEKGSNRATIETLDKLAKAFGISISDLDLPVHPFSVLPLGYGLPVWNC